MSINHLIVDARCLQDEGLRFRGVGQFSATMLRRCRFELGNVRLTAVVDPWLPELPADHAALFDSISTTSYIETDDNTWFLEPSPMTHAIPRVARCLSHLRGRRIAIIHDFIPLDMPESYLQDPIKRFDYNDALESLAYYDVFVCNSESTLRRLEEICGCRKSTRYISGVPVRVSLLAARETLPRADLEPYILVAGGGDPRKNVETVILAFARSSTLRASAVTLLILGSYSPARRAELKALFVSNGGSANHFRIAADVTDDELVGIYRGALVTVCPSLMEGFSIPVVEANASGSPVIVSNCSAHTELIPWVEDQFDPTDVDAIRVRLESIWTDETCRDKIVERQVNVWTRFTEDACGQRFWSPIVNLAAKPTAPTVLRNVRPRIAFITPLPPARSGVADYSAATLAALTCKAEVDVFSDTAMAKSGNIRAALYPISSYPYVARQYDAIVSVIGNSELHRQIFDMVLEFGGGVIAHDARMLDYYYWVCGKERAVRQASFELGRPVHVDELQSWLDRPDRMETLFLGEVVRSGSPTFVHSAVTKRIIDRLYKKDVVALPFCSYRGLIGDCDQRSAKIDARRRLDVEGNQFLVVTFGAVSSDRLPSELLWSIKMLRSWKINAILVFVGSASESLAAWLRSEAREWGVEDCIRISSSYVSEDMYRDYLFAADAAVQLRQYDFGGLSGALLDCIEVALPTVANSSLAEAMEAPSFVRRIPNGISPVLLAEELVSIFEECKPRSIDDARAFKQTHNFEIYTQRLLNTFGLDSSDA